MTKHALEGYGLAEIGKLVVVDDRFVISVHDDSILSEQRTIYAFLIGDEIVRIGSSKAPLRTRLRAWQRDVSAALQGEKSATSLSEAANWRVALANQEGLVFARRGTMIETPVGDISAYLSEETALIERHKPRFCRR